ncbi:MAG: 2-hydroxychromene-2-carboxylate isomerase [Myxococcota bacterium]|nr:2-hydroxychromene-2-carboxylate isomerase [Myxococcota bacterium]
MPAAPRIRFYFDPISSNAYLAWCAIPALAARHGAAIEPVPVLFAGLLEAHGQLGPAEVRPKALWMWRNNLRKAADLGVELHPPAFHPFNPLRALRVASLPDDAGPRCTLAGAVLRAVWVEGLHVSEPEVMARVATAAGFDGPRLVEEAARPEAKARLRAQTDAAIADGVFGVPTMRVGEELFWGFDDLPWLDRHLAGEDPLALRDAPPPGAAIRASAVRRRFRQDGGDA